MPAAGHDPVPEQVRDDGDAGRAGGPDVGGDPACWANRVCQACGRLNEAERPTTCEACGEPFEV